MATAMSVVVEYPSVVGAAAVGVLVLVRVIRSRDWALLGLFVAGCLPPAFLMGWFHTAAFGAPWRTAYATLENPQFVKDIAPGFMGIRGPQWENIEGSFLAPYNGMFFFAPWFALIIPALLALPWVIRRIRRPEVRGAAWTSAAVVLLFSLFIACHSLWRGGWTLGPRYIVGFVPFAALLIMLRVSALRGAWQTSARFILGGLVVVSILVTGSCSLVCQGFPTAFYNPLREATIPLLFEGYATRTLGHSVGMTGIWAWLPVFAALGWVFWVIGAGIPRKGPRLLRPIAVLGALGLAGCVFWVLMLPAEQPTVDRVGAVAWLKDHYEEDGGYPAAQEELRDLRAMTRAFHSDHHLAAYAVTEETRAGKWKDAKKMARRWTEGRWKRLRRRGQAAATMGAFEVMGGVRSALPLWDPQDFVSSLWAVSKRPRRRVLPPERPKVPKETIDAEALHRGAPEDRPELLFPDPLEILRKEARKRGVLPELRNPRFLRRSAPVLGTDRLTDVAPEEGPRASHRRGDVRGERVQVLDRPIGEAAPRVEDPIVPKGLRGAGSLAPPAVPAGAAGPHGMEPHEVPVDGEPAEVNPGAVDRVDEAPVAADAPEPGVDGDGLLHDRGAVHEDPAPDPEPSPEGEADGVEPAP